jgi:hypothetical protein
MARSSGTYTAPTNSFNPAVEGTEIDEGDFNTLLDDIEAALTESTYTAGLGATDNQLVRTDGTDTKKVQGTGITVDDSNNVTGVAALTATTVNIGNADTTLSRTGAGDIAVEGNAVYRAGGTDVPITDGGTGASTATAAFNALAPTTTQGDLIYHNGTNNVRLGTGTAGQVLTSGGAGANPSWSSAGAGDVTGAASSVDGEIALFDGTGGKTIKRASTTGLLKAASGVLSAASAGTDYYAPSGTDVAIADGGTGASTAATGFRALAEGISSTQGAVLYRDGTQWVALGPGTSGQVLQTGGAAANPAWATVSGTGDVTAASSFGTDNRIVRSDGTGKGVQASAITVDDSGNISGAGTVNSVYIHTIAPPLPQGRLTLTTLTPVLSSTVSGATTVYYTPYVGQFVPIYDGTRWTMHDIGGELNQATTDSTKSPAAVTTNSNYDLFVWNDSGTYRCTRGPAWTSDTARGTGAGTTELERVRGVLVNKISITNGPAAQRGTYVGTIRTNGSSQVDFITGGSAAGGTAAVFNIWNAYNRVEVYGLTQDSTASWTYNSTTLRTANSSSTIRASFVSGLAEDLASGEWYCVSGGSAPNTAVLAIGYDSTTAGSGKRGYTPVGVTASAFASYSTTALGYHYMQALESINLAATVTFYGSGTGAFAANAFTFRFRM